MCNCNKITICTEFDAAQIAGLQVPIASIHAFATQTVPDGYLSCDGSAVSRVEYADLFAALGTVWGEGDGSTTFNIPDLRGEFLRGFDAGRGVDEGRVFASWQKPSIAGFDTNTDGLHGVSTSVVSGQIAESAGYDQYEVSDFPNVILRGLPAPNYSDPLPGPAGQFGYSGATRPRNVAVTYAIKASQPAAA